MPESDGGRLCVGGSLATGPFDVAPRDLARAMRVADPGVMDDDLGRRAACAALLRGVLTGIGVPLGRFDELTVARVAAAVGPAGVQTVTSWLSLAHGTRLDSRSDGVDRPSGLGRSVDSA